MRLGGAALLASVTVLVIGFVVIAGRGQIRGLGAGFMGVEGIGRDAAALSTLMKALAVFGILQVLGFGVLASALSKTEEATLGLVSFGLWVFASAAAVIRAVSEGTLTVWAGNQWAETGSVPEMYEPLNAFAQQSFLWYAEVPWAIAAAGFGWAVIRSGVLPPWIGYVVVGWSVLWLLFPLLFRFDLPAFLLLYPLIFGFGMIFSRSGG
jgi:hypothetical protein